MHQLEELLRHRLSLEDCADFFRCSPDTIERRIRENADMTFSEFRKQSMVHTRLKLIKHALTRAEESDTMAIFCLKNICGWKDKQPGEEGPAVAVNNNQISVTDEQLINLTKIARGSNQ
jgi:AraC-like DNA-binding protein